MNSSFSRFLKVIILSFVSFFALSCAQPTTQEFSSLLGYWKSPFDGFEIKVDTTTNPAIYTYSQYDDAAKNISFEGTIVSNVLTLNNESGYITILITKPGTWGKTLNSYYVLSWKNMTKTTTSQSSAFIYGGSKNNGLPTQAEAESEYTIANGYFGYYGEYTRQ